VVRLRLVVESRERRDYGPSVSGSTRHQGCDGGERAESMSLDYVVGLIVMIGYIVYLVRSLRPGPRKMGRRPLQDTVGRR